VLIVAGVGAAPSAASAPSMTGARASSAGRVAVVIRSASSNPRAGREP
jgi:hypothetical protein